MKAPMSWLMRYVDLHDVSPKQIQDILTLRGIEISTIDDVYGEITNVVVGHVVDMVAHPDSDHMFICQVDVGAETPVQIVTGAQNVSIGDWVPAALHGATLPNNIKIKKGKLRGQASNGMLCSGEELLLKEGDYPTAGVDGIMLLQGDSLTAGMDIKEFLNINEVVFEAEPTPNRPDCLSMIGLARELASALNRELILPAVMQVGEELINQGSDEVNIHIEAEELCFRYMARSVENVHIEPSPDWMQKSLRLAGINAINNIVDITNYVMLECGQPMHAFDFSCVNGKQIIVRRAKEGETIQTLDEKERILTKDMLVIADESKPIAVAGVMGGANSEITENTKTILLESAVFASQSVRKTAKALGMNSESAMRYSKGIDIEGAKRALLRACQLMKELQVGEVSDKTYDVCHADLTRKTLRVRVERVNRILALALTVEEMANLTQSLFLPTTIHGNELEIEIPHFRDDIEGEADIAEEVARVVGHDAIKPTLMRGNLIRGKLTKQQKQMDAIRMSLCGLGADEIITYAFTGNAEYDKLMLSETDPLRTQSVQIKNPFGEENALMRTTLATGMLNVIETNLKRKNMDFRLFEIGNVHQLGKEGELPEQKQMLCIGCVGVMEDFYLLKGMIENVFKTLNAPPSWTCVAGGSDYYHPGRKAMLTIGRNTVGQFGEVHPDVCDHYDVKGRAYLAEISLDDLLPLCGTKEKKYIPISRYPSVERDLAIVVVDETESGRIVEQIQKVGGKELQSVRLFDIYKGEAIEEGKKSLAYSLRYQSNDRTLTEGEVNQSVKTILQMLEQKFDAKLR